MNIVVGYLCVGLIILIPLFIQINTYQSIDESKFKKHKIRKFSFLFRGMQGESVCNHGIILPMLIIQIQGYLLGILSIVLLVLGEIMYFFSESVFIVIIILLIHTIIVVTISAITGFASKRRPKNKHEYSHFDKLFEMYLNGRIKNILSKYDSSIIEINNYNIKGKMEKTIRIAFNSQNNYVIMNFFEDKYNLAICTSGTSADDLEKIYTDYEYTDDFTFRKLLKSIDFPQSDDNSGQRVWQ